MSYQYLIGATADYLEDLQGSRFIIHNPNAKTTCGCGSSPLHRLNIDNSLGQRPTARRFLLHLNRLLFVYHQK
jgi:hypothetical protein